ncbi:serine/threonine-protein kinase [Streptomyces sp. 184]|uniref:serine/threonine-protein kinase n=1 Tax=Streptomyces sp. 184 TaxID=1827526 RepID=UPI00389123D9
MSGGPGELVDGRFELIERLGSGGMGTVWRARDTVLEREVALKEVRPPDPAHDAEMVRERVLREARALARLSHPHVVTIHHIVAAEPHPWLVMELVPGPNLGDRLATAGPLPPPEAARLGRDVLAALTAAHAAGIHHRDVKPANVLLHPGEPHERAVLTDFGIAALAGSTALTATGEVVGSPEYVAPERIRGAPDAPPADLWSLGMTLYVAVEGTSPLRRGTALATLAAVLDEPLAPPRRAGALAPVLDALLVRDPGARPDAAALDGMLRAAAAGEFGAAPVYAPRPAPAPSPPPAPATSPASPSTTPYAQRPAPYTPTALDSPRPTAPAAAPGRGRRGGLLVGVLAAAVVVLGGTVAGLLLIPGDDGGPGAAGDGTASTAPAGGAGKGDGNGDGKDAGADDANEDATQDGKDAGDGGTGGPSGQQDPTSSPSSSPQPPGSSPPNDSWIAVLASEPVANGAAARDDRLANVRAEVPEAELLRSDDYPSLRPGYWVIHAPGPFADGKEAIAFCADRGRTAINACYGRYLSQDPDDSRLQCHPADGGSGRCSRE